MLSISVEIVDDKVFEGREDFSLILDSPQPRVVFNPQQTSIAITDNEGEGPKTCMQGFIIIIQTVECMGIPLPRISNLVSFL